MWYRLNPSETRMRPLLLSLLLIAALACAGCLKVYEAGISVRPGTVPASWSTADTPPDLAFTISNDHAKPIGAINVAIHLEVLDGGSGSTDANLTLLTTPSGVTGGRGAWRISGLQSGQTMTLKPVTAFEPGRYRLTATITPENAVKERSTDDNVAAIDFIVNAAAAVEGMNLSVAGPPTSIAPVGDSIEFRLPITVTGPAGSSAHMVRIDVYTDDRDQYWSVYRTLAASPTGQVHSLQLKALAPLDSSGVITIEVDPTRYIPESADGDNTVSFNYPLTGMM